MSVQSGIVDIVEFENDPGLRIVTSHDDFMAARVGHEGLELVVMPGAQATGFDDYALTLGRLFNLQSCRGVKNVSIAELSAAQKQVPYGQREAGDAILHDMDFALRQGYENETVLQITKPEGYADLGDPEVYQPHRDHGAPYSQEYIQRSYNQLPTDRVRAGDAVKTGLAHYFDLRPEAVPQSLGHQGLRRYAVLTEQNQTLASPIHLARKFTEGYYLFLRSVYQP